MIKFIYIIFGILLTLKCHALDGGLDKVDEEFKNGGIELIPKLDNMLGYIIGLFYFIAVVFGIYGGFMILTSGGEEERVKKGKNIIIYVAIGLIVIFLTSQFVYWIINVMTDTDIVN